MGIGGWLYVAMRDQGMSFWGGKGDTDGAEGFQVHVLYAVARCPSFLYLPDVLRSAASGLDERVGQIGRPPNLHFFASRCFQNPYTSRPPYTDSSPETVQSNALAPQRVPPYRNTNSPRQSALLIVSYVRCRDALLSLVGYHHYRYYRVSSNIIYRSSGCECGGCAPQGP
ncbi:predicted protein [Histoplasma capsulatum var. duboisii H88]|uniref:Predicted protein n=2 Tax=Ajellomyces capsulatus TaxID=5037 RepID=F0UTQ7_AJEC8|nr:predicted protein [Histoplasma capsulatum H143]EGC49284.1 predicted protein [Histoplasma capsulatum var. duboisii H88]